MRVWWADVQTEGMCQVASALEQPRCELVLLTGRKTGTRHFVTIGDRYVIE